MSSRFCVVVKARTGAGKEGLVPENYIRVWNPVDDVGDDDMNEVNVDDDIPVGERGLTPSDNYKYANHSDSGFIIFVFVVFLTCSCQSHTIVLYEYFEL